MTKHKRCKTLQIYLLILWNGSHCNGHGIVLYSNFLMGKNFSANKAMRAKKTTTARSECESTSQFADSTTSSFRSQEIYFGTGYRTVHRRSSDRNFRTISPNFSMTFFWWFLAEIQRSGTLRVH